MNNQFTPGPWVVLGQYSDRSVFPIGHAIDANAHGILAEVNSLGGTPERQAANARLIAAAPQLLEALQRIQNNASARVWNGGDGNGPDFQAFKEIEQQARTAIASATGWVKP